ncbi:MAG: outer membrane lipoprotein carrier protein LolA [Bacteroidales bacterium]
MKTIYKSILVLLLSILVFPSFAISLNEKKTSEDETIISPNQLMDRMDNALSMYKVLSLNFVFSAKDDDDEIASQEGRFYAMASMYKIEAEDFDLYCDGVKKWFYNKEANEINVFSHDSSSLEITDNPLVAIKSISEMYKVSKAEVKKLGEGWSITLEPKVKGDYKFITLDISSDNYLPILISCVTNENREYFISLKNFSEMGNMSENFFTPDISSMGDVMVNEID